MSLSLWSLRTRGSPPTFCSASHSRRSFPIFETISHNHPQCGLSRQELALLFDNILLFFSWSICKTCPSLFFCTIFSTIRETIALNRGRTFPSSPTQRTSAAWTSKLHFELVSHTCFYIIWSNNSSTYCQTCVKLKHNSSLYCWVKICHWRLCLKNEKRKKADGPWHGGRGALCVWNIWRGCQGGQTGH